MGGQHYYYFARRADVIIMLLRRSSSIIIVPRGTGRHNNNAAAEAKAAKPKRGPTGYFLFMKENRADIVKNHSDCPVTEIASKLGETWRSLDESKRAEWNAKAKELAPKPTPEQIAAVEAKASKPKRPPTAFFNYMSKMRDNIKKQHPDWTVTQISSYLGEQWRSLNKEEKDKFKSTDKSI